MEKWQGGQNRVPILQSHHFGICIFWVFCVNNIGIILTKAFVVQTPLMILSLSPGTCHKSKGRAQNMFGGTVEGALHSEPVLGQ